MESTSEKVAQVFFVLILLSNIAIGQTFHHDFDAAKKLATENDQRIALIFSGSDWCKPCIQLRETILSDAKFVNYADKKLVLVDVDFPYKKANRLPKEQLTHNEKLADQYNPEGIFPRVILTDEQGKVLGEFTFDKRLAVPDYIHHVEKIITD